MSSSQMRSSSHGKLEIIHKFERHCGCKVKIEERIKGDKVLKTTEESKRSISKDLVNKEVV